MACKIKTIACFLALVLFVQCKKTAIHHHTTAPQSSLAEFFTYSEAWKPMISAHRGGGYEAGYPENAIESFERIISKHPALIECDVRMSADSVLVLLHDRSLPRTTNGSGNVDDKLWAELRNTRLKDHTGQLTDFRIPSLEAALEWAKGKTILTLDIKQGVPFEKVNEIILQTETEDNAAVITYSAGAAKAMYDINPNLVLSVSMRNEKEVQWMKDTGIPPSNMIAFTGTVLSDASLFDQINDMGIVCILGTLGNLDRQTEARGDHYYQMWIDHGADILATDRPEAAFNAINQD